SGPFSGVSPDRAARARVRLAETLAKAGKKAEAKKVFQSVAESAGPAQKKAAEIGLKNLG
ncbi:MAG: hypothetical protein ACRDD1_01135, partial [Planctomycetia bacterium]